ncbi:porin [Vibrio splendidus]|nr:porin [Vibrio splendidus]MCC4883005.1 porin [Vibrio splendidus]
MKKSLLVVALGSLLTAGAATAAEPTTAVETASKAGFAIEKNLYVGAELGANVLTGDQAEDVDYWNMAKVGGDVKVAVHPELKLIAGGEAQVAFGGADLSGEPKGFDGENLLVERMVVGVETRLGTTTFGKQEGILDDFTGFADLSKEHGLDSGSIETNSQFNHVINGQNFQVGAAFDLEEDYMGLAGSYTHGQFTVGGSVIKGTNFVNPEDVTENDMSGDIDYLTVDLGVVADLGKLDLAAKVIIGEADEAGNGTKSESLGYAVSAAYEVSEKLSVATSFNMADVEYKGEGEGFSNSKDDQWGTVGASYAVNQNVELVTEYKFASEIDDTLFLRANINF